MVQYCFTSTETIGQTGSPARCCRWEFPFLCLTVTQPLQRQPSSARLNDEPRHTPIIAFRHPPPNSARFQRRGQRPLKGSGTNMTQCRSNLAPKRHARKHETHPPRVKRKDKKRVPSRFKQLWFYLCWCKLLAAINDTPCFI